MSDLEEHYQGLLRRAFGARHWILAMDELASMRGVVDDLRELGALSVMCVAASRGVGDAPDEEFAPGPIVLGVSGQDMMSRVRAALVALADLPDEAVAAVDAYDPAREALVLGSLFDDGKPVAGRRKYGARPQRWQALEDKTIIDAFWDEIGVPRSPSRVVDADDIEGLRDACRALDHGDDTVWAADNREGFHGGASFTRWVRSDAQFDATQRYFAQHADRIRVMPFLEGIPCSIHGIVFPDDDVVVLRPCEMLVFRRDDGTFHYGRAATFWDPPPEDREAMRDLARRVGRHLSQHFDYRGAFTIDGVMTREGFRPTELNPRLGAALGILSRNVGFPTFLVNLAIVEGEPFDWRPRELEARLLESSDALRSGGTSAVSARGSARSEKVELVMDGDGFRLCRHEEPVDVTLIAGPTASGCAIIAGFHPERTPVGPSLGPRAAAVLQWADAEYDLGLGTLTPAVDVRSVGSGS